MSKFLSRLAKRLLFLAGIAALLGGCVAVPAHYGTPYAGPAPYGAYGPYGPYESGPVYQGPPVYARPPVYVGPPLFLNFRFGYRGHRGGKHWHGRRD